MHSHRHFYKMKYEILFSFSSTSVLYLQNHTVKLSRLNTACEHSSVDLILSLYMHVFSDLTDVFYTYWYDCLHPEDLHMELVAVVHVCNPSMEQGVQDRRIVYFVNSQGYRVK